MTHRRHLWYLRPMVILAACIVVAGAVFIVLLNRNADQAKKTNSNSTNRMEKPATCGDGICQNVACLSTNCPKPETLENCPEDCAPASGSTGSPDQSTNENNNKNTNAVVATVLDFSIATQPMSDQQSCPFDSMNLTASGAVAIAARAGLQQGKKPVGVSLSRYHEPLDQCVWSVRNYLTDTSGREMIIVDSTQEILQASDWGTSR